jgi:hypothetical protein
MFHPLCAGQPRLVVSADDRRGKKQKNIGFYSFRQKILLVFFRTVKGREGSGRFLKKAAQKLLLRWA